MKKKYYFSSIMLIVFFSAFAQDYQCIDPESTSLFEKNNGYITTLRIDSMAVEGSDTIYFPMQTIRQLDYDCYSPSGPSWIGEKIVKRPDGSWLFYNFESDTILIYPEAKQGEQWEMYSKNELIVEASVSSVISSDVLDLPDSVKTISFTAYNGSHQPIEHAVESMQLQIGKAYGISRIPNFYFFPDHQEDFFYNIFEEYELVGIDKPEAGIQNLTWKSIHDYNPGDEIHTVYHQSYETSSHEIKTIKKLISKSILGDTTVYLFQRWIENISQNYDEEPVITTSYDTLTLYITPDSLFDMLPGEVIMSDYDAYTHQMTGNMKEIPSEAERIIKSDDENCWNIPIVDDCISSLLYYKGLGGPYHSCTYPFSFGEISNTFVYYKKGDTEWGTPLIITSLDTKKGIPDGIRIYPNPADNYLNVEYPLTGEKTAYEIVNCMGETISMKGEFFSEVQAIPIAFLPAGLYCIKLTDTSGNVYSQTFIKK